MFKTHLTARICTIFGLQSTSDIIPHEKSLAWLQSTAEKLVTETVMPMHAPSSDTLYIMHRTFLHLAFLYVDLRCAIRYERGPYIVRLWKLWLPRLTGTRRKNYCIAGNFRMVQNFAFFADWSATAKIRTAKL